MSNNMDTEPSKTLKLQTDTPLIQAWHTKLQGMEGLFVIFNSKVYTNVWWVEEGTCPGNVDKDGTQKNPWREIRNATAAEIQEHGNPTRCDQTDIKITLMPIQAWTAELKGAGPFYVIFQSRIYQNKNPVDAGECPGDTKNTNPWKFLRNATPEETGKYVNPNNCSDTASITTLQAWKALEGQAKTLFVIFANKIYRNELWVSRKTCPGNLEKNGASNNSWRILRDATKEEIAQYGNPISCNDRDEESSSLQAWKSTLTGNGPFLVIFSGKVYKNRCWIGPEDCPGKLYENDLWFEFTQCNCRPQNKEKDHNPWQLERNATLGEIDKYGNPTDCK